MLVRVLSIISMVCCSMTMLTIFLNKNLQSFAFQLVLFVVTNDFFFALAFACPSAIETFGADSWQCSLQAFSTNYFLLSSIMWSCATGYLISDVIVASKSLSRKKGFNTVLVRRYLIFFCQILPCIPSMLPVLLDGYGDSGNGWCWVKKGSGKYYIYRLFTIYLWNWMAIFYCVYVYIVVTKSLAEISESQDENHWTGSSGWKTLKYYPLVLLVSSMFPTADRFIGLFHHSYYWLKVAHALARTSMGILDSAIFFFTPKVTREVLRSLEYVCTSLRSESSPTSSTDKSMDGYTKNICESSDDVDLTDYHNMVDNKHKSRGAIA